MTGQDPNNTDQFEADIQALLDGDLDDRAAAKLKAAAAADQRLARAIVEAWQLQKQVDQLGIEPAPASLRRKLRRIPLEQREGSGRHWLGVPRWALAGGAAAVAVLAVVLMLDVPGPGEVTATPALAETPPTPQRVRQARQDLQVAFSYLDKIGLRTGLEIQHVLSEELATPVRDQLHKHIPYTGNARKEKHA